MCMENRCGSVEFTERAAWRASLIRIPSSTAEIAERMGEPCSKVGTKRSSRVAQEM